MRMGFKEWQVVCEALGNGKQSILLRKGGIAEGREGFQFKHGEFYLFPTLFHAQLDKVRAEGRGEMTAPSEKADAKREQIEIELFARVEFHRVISDWVTVESLEPFHIWAKDEIRKRFDWEEEPGISLAMIRVYRLPEPWRLPNEKSYGGCRSWVSLPEPLEKQALEPVLGEEAFAARRAQVLEVIGS